MGKKKERKPKISDTVYQRNVKNAPAMLLVKITEINGIEIGNCIWFTSKLIDDELKSERHEANFLLSNLTLDAPPFLSDITKG